MPPIDDKDFEDMGSSPGPTDAQDNTPEVVAPDDANSSPAAQGENDEQDLLSVVRDVVDESRKPDDQSAPPAEGEEDPGQPDGQGDDDDYSDVPFHKHPRFQQLIRKEKAATAKAQTYEQDATRYRNVQNFMDQNGLQAEEAADLLVVGGLMKTNPVEAWKRAKPMIQKLLIAAGEVLPDDLRGRVEKGELSSDAALEVSRTRAMQQSMQATQSFQEQRRQHQQQQDAVSAVTSAAETWEADRRKKDPNFEAKLPSLMEKVAYLQRVEGVPNTPDGVKAQLQKAYKALTPLPAVAAPSVPQKRAITPIRGGQVAGGAKPEVSSTMDVLNNVIARRRNA